MDGLGDELFILWGVLFLGGLGDFGLDLHIIDFKNPLKKLI